MKIDVNDIKLLSIIPLAILALQLIVTATNVEPNQANYRTPAVIAATK